MINWQKYAKVLVDYSTKVKENDLVVIRGDVQAQPLILAIYDEVLKRGANPIVRLAMEGTAESFFKYYIFRYFNFWQVFFINPFYG